MKRIPAGLLLLTLAFFSPLVSSSFADETADQLATQDGLNQEDSDTQDQSAGSLAKQHGVSIKGGQDNEESANQLATQQDMDQEDSDSQDETADQLATQQDMNQEDADTQDETAHNLAKKMGLEKKNKRTAPASQSVFADGDGVDGTIYAAVTQPDGKVIIGGRFTTVNSLPRLNLARINADGTLDTTFLAGPTDGVNGTVYALGLDASGNLLVGGYFSQAQDQPRQNLVRYLASGKLDTAFDEGQSPNGPVYAITVQKNGQFVVGGEFTMVGNVERRNLARFNPDGTLDGTKAPATGSTGSVRSLTPLGAGVAAGGTFEIAGQPARNILSLP